LIVGAGPTGLTAALELTRFGIPVRLVDQYTAPSATSRALAVHVRTGVRGDTQARVACTALAQRACVGGPHRRLRRHV
jgi:2-polyprenyl-6-methoxyphenol hydroxylase-like FAD-dependent oxidoreductase